MTTKRKITDPEVKKELAALGAEIKELRKKVREMEKTVDDSYTYDYNTDKILGIGEESDDCSTVECFLDDVDELLSSAEYYFSEDGVNVGYQSSFVNGGW